MTFEEFLKTLDISGENYLVESGTPQKLRHYTDIKGLRNILRAGFLRPQPLQIILRSTLMTGHIVDISKLIFTF